MRIRKLCILLILLALLALLPVLSACIPGNNACVPETVHAPEPTATVLPRTIIHAGGALWGRDSFGNYRMYTGSNSLEGLLQCADAGVNAAELDFSFTSDGALVCIHNWSDVYIAGIGNGAPLTLAAFTGSKIYGQFTPLTLSDAAEFLRTHENITLVTDIKECFDDAVRLIADACADFLDRVVVQIYAEEQYDTVRALGFTKIAYTLYALPWEKKLDTGAHISFAESHELAWIAFDASLCASEAFLQAMTESGVPLYVHTVNDEKIKENLLDIGITGVYTDSIIRNSP